MDDFELLSLSTLSSKAVGLGGGRVNWRKGMLCSLLFKLLE